MLAVKINSIDEVENKLNNLKPKKKTVINLDEAIYRLRHALNRAKRNGYSYAELVELLRSSGIETTEQSLKQSLSRANNRHKKKKKSNYKAAERHQGVTQSSRQNTSELSASFQPESLAHQQLTKSAESHSQSPVVSEQSPLPSSLSELNKEQQPLSSPKEDADALSQPKVHSALESEFNLRSKPRRS